MSFAKRVTGRIGNTPLVRINRLTQGCVARGLARLEFKNSPRSVKDTIGLAD